MKFGSDGVLNGSIDYTLCVLMKQHKHFLFQLWRERVGCIFVDALEKCLVDKLITWIPSNVTTNKPTVHTRTFLKCWTWLLEVSSVEQNISLTSHLFFCAYNQTIANHIICGTASPISNNLNARRNHTCFPARHHCIRIRLCIRSCQSLRWSKYKTCCAKDLGLRYHGCAHLHIFNDLSLNISSWRLWSASLNISIHFYNINVRISFQTCNI